MHKLKLEYINYEQKISPKNMREREHFVAYSTLKIMLKQYFDIENPHILKTENGKPYIDNESVHFSIAHTEGLACVAISDTPIGVDCELMKDRSAEEIKRFSDRFFTENEINLLEKENYSVTAFYKIWTAKEATVKKLGVNMSFLRKIDTTKENLRFFEENNYIVCINI